MKTTRKLIRGLQVNGPHCLNAKLQKTLSEIDIDHLVLIPKSSCDPCQVVYERPES